MADLTQEYFLNRMKVLGVDASTPVAVAVSGGVDSMALAHLAFNSGVAVRAFTVDHRLRPESSSEALRVKTTLESWGMRCDMLVWQEAAGGSAVQARAREARYRLLADACAQHSIKHLLLGHQLDDQAETFWLRLIDGSGPDGLGGMKAQRASGKVVLLRPLLNVTRAEISAYASENNIPVIEDPSNRADKFTRVRLRGLADQLAEEGLTPQRLGLVMQKISDASAALDWVRDDFLSRHARAHRAGAFFVDEAAWKNLPADLQRRVLIELISRHSPAAYPPRHQAVEDLRLALCAAAFGGATLQGCHVFLRDGSIWIAREVAAIASHIRVGAAPMVWDNRFVVQAHAEQFVQTHAKQGVRAAAGELRLGSLAAGGLSQLSVKETPELAALPEIARAGLPAIYEGEKLLFIPYLSDKDGTLNTTLAPDFCKTLNIV